VRFGEGLFSPESYSSDTVSEFLIRQSLFSGLFSAWIVKVGTRWLEAAIRIGTRGLKVVCEQYSPGLPSASEALAGFSAAGWSFGMTAISRAHFTGP